MEIKLNVFNVFNKITSITFFVMTRYDFHKNKSLSNNKLNIHVYINIGLKTKWQIHTLIKLKDCILILLVNINNLATL